MSADLHLTAQQICDANGISRRMLFNAKKVRRNGCDELNQAVINGDVTINLALEIARFNHDSQRLIMAEFHDIKPRDRLAFVQRVFAAATLERAGGTL